MDSYCRLLLLADKARQCTMWYVVFFDVYLWTIVVMIVVVKTWHTPV